jgi:hypothetical protein
MKSETGNHWRTALLLEYFTVAYNISEAAISILFGTLAGSIALVGFGQDSIVESFSGFILIWRLRQHDTSTWENGRESRELPSGSWLPLFLSLEYTSLLNPLVN